MRIVLWIGVLNLLPFAAAAEEVTRPKLVLVLSVDQLRADYLPRYARHFVPAKTQRDGKEELGGFLYLKEQGASFADARHSHFPLFTGPGHAVQLTGAPLYKSGIVGNYWFDAHEKRERRYCVEDLSARGEIIGTDGPIKRSPGISPVTLEASTVGDELRIATGNRAKVWGLALKDRAAVLMAGHMANGALWFDEITGDWISSRYYFPDGKLPEWLREVNRGGEPRLADALRKRVWEFSGEGREKPWTGAAAFRHEQTSTNYKHLTFTPHGNELVLETAKRLVEREELGEDEVPDLLALNFSSNDYVGHEYGADSAETADITIRLDAQLGSFFTWLDQRLGITNVLIALTSDHGAAPYPAQARDEAHFDADIANERAIEQTINRKVGEWYGFRSGETNAVRLIEYNLYIRMEALNTRKSGSEVEHEVAAFVTRHLTNGYFLAYGSEQIQKGQMPKTDIAERLMKSFHTRNSGNVILVPRPFWIHLDPAYKYKTSHGSPYTYDTAVPLLLAGPRIAQGEFLGTVSTLDLAPTLAHLLGVLAPSGSEGGILKDAIQRNR